MVCHKDFCKKDGVKKEKYLFIFLPQFSSNSSILLLLKILAVVFRLVCVYRTTLHFNLHSFMIRRHCSDFRYKGTKVLFYSVFASFLLVTWFLYLYACAVENPEISAFCISEIRAVATDHKKVKKNKK